MDRRIGAHKGKKTFRIGNTRRRFLPLRTACPAAGCDAGFFALGRLLPGERETDCDADFFAANGRNLVKGVRPFFVKVVRGGDYHRLRVQS